MMIYNFTGQAPRDLPPRFARLAQQQQQQIAQQAASANGTAVMIPSTTEEISLRPAKNFTVFKANGPNNLTKASQVSQQNAMMKMSLGPPEPPKPLLNKQVGFVLFVPTAVRYKVANVSDQMWKFVYYECLYTAAKFKFGRSQI